MLTDTDYKTCEELKSQLSGFVNLIDYRAFGSRIRGDHDNDSDLDIFIEVENLSLEIRRKIQKAACEISIKKHIYISPLIFSRAEIEDTPMRASDIVLNIKQNGVVI